MTGAKFRFGPEFERNLLAWVQPTLELGQRQGIIAPGAVAPHVDHAIGFAEAWHQAVVKDSPRVVEAVPSTSAPLQAVDLGSGAGLPALVLAGIWTESRWVFTETRQKRSEFLSRAISRLDLGDRVTVWAGDVQELPVTADTLVDLVTARAFGKPGLVAECAARLLQPGGHIIVSEPGPGQIERRWPDAALSAHDFTATAIETTRGAFAQLTFGSKRPELRNRRTMERAPWF